LSEKEDCGASRDMTMTWQTIFSRSQPAQSFHLSVK